MEKYMSLEQNLCSARIFLNIFDLVLETKEETNEFTKLKILDKNNSQVGMLYFENDVVKIQSVTSLGNLNANYEIVLFSEFQDLGCSYAFFQCKHAIKFQIAGNLSFSGDMQIDSSMDIHFGNTCIVHTKIEYIDKGNNEVKLKFMDDGKLFSYEAEKTNFKEILEINPWSDFESFMNHIIRYGEYNTTQHCFPDEMVKFVWQNSNDDRNYLRTVSHIVEDLQIKENESKLYGKDKSVDSTIQSSLLMHQIDPDFSKKIIELKELFKKDGVSFFENLIDVSFDRVNEEERKALFGTDIQRISYYNGADNLLDAYFDISKKDGYTKLLKKQDSK